MYDTSFTLFWYLDYIELLCEHSLGICGSDIIIMINRQSNGVLEFSY